jgi:hypothetical protein
MDFDFSKTKVFGWNEDCGDINEYIDEKLDTDKWTLVRFVSGIKYLGKDGAILVFQKEKENA